MVVSLVKGAAQHVVQNRLRHIFAAMHLDPELDHGAAACALLATAADLVVRFRVFFLYPFKLAKLSKLWFPNDWLPSMLEFLREEKENLDIGVGLQLQTLARLRGKEAITWLASPAIQGFIHQLCEEALSTSLPVERRLGEVKQWETSRSTNIATASRNMIIVRFAKQREHLARAVARAKEYKKKRS